MCIIRYNLDLSFSIFYVWQPSFFIFQKMPGPHLHLFPSSVFCQCSIFIFFQLLVYCDDPSSSFLIFWYMAVLHLYLPKISFFRPCSAWLMGIGRRSLCSESSPRLSRGMIIILQSASKRFTRSRLCDAQIPDLPLWFFRWSRDLLKRWWQRQFNNLRC